MTLRNSGNFWAKHGEIDEMIMPKSDLEQMYNAGYEAGSSNTVSCPAHCPIFNAAVNNCTHEKYIVLGKEWWRGFHCKIDENVAALMDSWKDEEADEGGL